MRVSKGENAMLKMILIGATLAALLASTASAQEQAAVRLPDVQNLERMQELVRRAEHRNYYNYYDAFGTPVFDGGLAVELRNDWRWPEPTWEKADVNLYDAFGLPISITESTLLAEGAFVPTKIAAAPRPLAEGEAQIP
jgi:hypothetical protein